VHCINRIVVRAKFAVKMEYKWNACARASGFHKGHHCIGNDRTIPFLFYWNNCYVELTAKHRDEKIPLGIPHRTRMSIALSNTVSQNANINIREKYHRVIELLVGSSFFKRNYDVYFCIRTIRIIIRIYRFIKLYRN